LATVARGGSGIINNILPTDTRCLCRVSWRGSLRRGDPAVGAHERVRQRGDAVPVRGSFGTCPQRPCKCRDRTASGGGGAEVNWNSRFRRSRPLPPAVAATAARRDRWRVCCRDSEAELSDVGDEVSQRKKVIRERDRLPGNPSRRARGRCRRMRHSQAGVQARSPAGQVRSLVGVLFSVILLARFVHSNARRQIYVRADYRSTSGVDPVTRNFAVASGPSHRQEEDLHTLTVAVDVAAGLHGHGL
jgi:hypothetical protein